MISLIKEKYLGDFVTNQANAKETLIAKKARAYAILTKIQALLSEIPLGTKRFEIGMDGFPYTVARSSEIRNLRKPTSLPRLWTRIEQYIFGLRGKIFIKIHFICLIARHLQ